MRYLSMFKDCMIRGGTGADPGTGVRPDIVVVIPHHRSDNARGAARRVSVCASFWWRAVGAWGCVVVVWRRWSAGYFLWESFDVAEGAGHFLLGKLMRL